MNPKEELVSTIVHVESWADYIACMKKCMNLFSIISDVKANLRFNNFMDSYSKIVKEFGTEVLFTPEKTRDDLVTLLNAEVAKNYDIFVTFRLCNAIILLNGIVAKKYNFKNVKCVTDILECVDCDKMTSYTLFMGFKELKNVML